MSILILFLFFLQSCVLTETRRKPERVFKGNCYVYLEEEELFRIFLRFERGRVFWSSNGLEMMYDIHDFVKKGDSIYQVNECSVKKDKWFIDGKNELPFISISFLILLRNRNEILRYIKKIYIKNAEGKKSVIDTSLLPDNEYAVKE